MLWRFSPHFEQDYLEFQRKGTVQKQCDFVVLLSDQNDLTNLIEILSTPLRRIAADVSPEKNPPN